MCLCYLCNRSIRLLEYIDIEAIRENITVKHVNKISLIRSSPNDPGLRLLVQSFGGGLYIMFSSRVFTTMSSIRDSLNRMKSVGIECRGSPYWNLTSEGHSSMTGLCWGVCLNLSSLQWSTQTLWLSLALSGSMLPSGQPDFYSLFYAIIFLRLANSCLPLCLLLFCYQVMALKPVCSFDCPFLLLGLIVSLPLSVRIPLLCVIITR